MFVEESFILRRVRDSVMVAVLENVILTGGELKRNE
jgi:hypothetical protein